MKIILGLFIGVLVGTAIESVGKPTLCTTYSASLPFVLFFTLATPALLGYLIGKDL